MDYREISQVSKNLGLPVKKILDMLFNLKNGDAIENNLLIRKVGISRNILNKVKREMSDILEPPSAETKLNSNGVDFVDKLFVKGYEPTESLWKFLKNDEYKFIVEVLNNYSDKRPEPNRDYDQFTATIETTAKRSSLLKYFHDLKDKKILFLGDDDLTSIGASIISNQCTIDVFDIDERILSTISEVSDDRNLQISTTKGDLRKDLPISLRNKFDIVFTDPPYTLNGMRLFLSRAIQSLDKSNKSARIYICYGNSHGALERYIPIQSLFTEFGLKIDWILGGFNRYIGAESIGSSSDLFICSVTSKTNVNIDENAKYKKFYTND